MKTGSHQTQAPDGSPERGEGRPHKMCCTASVPLLSPRGGSEGGRGCERAGSIIWSGFD